MEMMINLLFRTDQNLETPNSLFLGGSESHQERSNMKYIVYRNWRGKLLP